MAIHAYVGFLDGERRPKNFRGLFNSLLSIDSEHRELARLLYRIPGAGTHGVSCAGHFYREDEFGRFWPKPTGSLGIALLPEIKHIPELIDLIHAETEKDVDARVRIMNDALCWDFGPDYLPGMDLEPHSLFKTKKGLDIIKVRVELGENSSMDSVEDHCGGSIELKGNKESFNKTKQRYQELKRFWKNLENEVRAYTERHGFRRANYKKQEFMPFC